MVQACGNYTAKRKTEDASEVITTRTEVSYYTMTLILYCAIIDYSSISKNLIQGLGATEVSILRVKILCLQCTCYIYCCTYMNEIILY